MNYVTMRCDPEYYGYIYTYSALINRLRSFTVRQVTLNIDAFGLVLSQTLSVGLRLSLHFLIFIKI